MFIRALLMVGLLGGCGNGLAKIEDGEWYPGGDGTNVLLMGRNAFMMPAANLSAEAEQDFYSGNSFFNLAWVEAPASTEARDGLGPFFNARSCSGCHLHDGKGAPPEAGAAPFVGVLLRLSVPGVDGPVPDPILGGQLQDQANPNLAVEAEPSVTWATQSGTFEDGSTYELVVPTYQIDAVGPDALSPDLMMSPRVAPHMVGLGLLEAIPESRLEALADPSDSDEDGISGRVQRHANGVVGRFGWKADAPTVEAQVAGAFNGDMGLTSSLNPDENCSDSQLACLEESSGGQPEVSDDILGLVVLYSRSLAVPARRNAEDETVLRGKYLFNELDCAVCHVPSHTTGRGALGAFEGQLIWPYTDLLLHDMGEALSDNRPLSRASGAEWKTPPLWGLGLVKDVSGHTRFLHDGRARSLEEAILWHGGEAESSTEAYKSLDREERTAVVRFLEDL